MEKQIIYDNGEIKLAHQTKIQFKSKLNNKVLTGMVIGQEATQFIVWINPSITAKVHTQDILQVAISCKNDEYYISLNEYKSMKNNRLTYQDSCTIVNCLSTMIKQTSSDTEISESLRKELLDHINTVLKKYTALESQILELVTE